MADLIDRDKMFHGQVIYVGSEDARKGVQDVMNVIWDAPTIDAIPVVRCKACKWSDCDGRCIRNRLYRHNSITLEPESYFREVDPDDFCSWGERREDEK